MFDKVMGGCEGMFLLVSKGGVVLFYKMNVYCVLFNFFDGFCWSMDLCYYLIG